MTIARGCAFAAITGGVVYAIEAAGIRLHADPLGLWLTAWAASYGVYRLAQDVEPIIRRRWSRALHREAARRPYGGIPFCVIPAGGPIVWTYDQGVEVNRVEVVAARLTLAGVTGSLLLVHDDALLDELRAYQPPSA